MRWRDGEIWFVDTPHLKVIGTDGVVRTHATIPARLVLGLTFTAEGNALVGDALGRRFYRVNSTGQVDLAADLSEHFPHSTNEIVAAPDGSWYVGSMGFDILGGAAPQSSRLARVAVDGTVSSVGSDVMFPNGLAVGARGTTLLVAESFAGVITEFTIGPHGDLRDARSVADLTGRDAHHPDGIALDKAGVWYADPFNGSVVLVADGGEELDRITVPLPHPTSCAVGGHDGELVLVTATDQMANPDFTFSGGAALFAVERTADRP